MARPCQIVCSQDVWRHLRPRGEFAFDSLGERQLEGITGRVWVFSVHDPAGSPERGSQPLPVWRATLTRLARLGRVLIAYIIASVITWQLVRALTAQLLLPGWVEPLAIALLVVGLLVILGTGWVQARPTWERRVQQKPAWALDLSEAVEGLRHQRVPELTWPRAIVGGVMAFGVLFAIALAYVELGDAGGFLRPRAALAEPGRAVAILPFETSEGLDSWREGVPDLLALTLGSRNDLRVIDPLAVMSRAGDGENFDEPGSALELGRALDAVMSWRAVCAPTTDASGCAPRCTTCARASPSAPSRKAPSPTASHCSRTGSPCSSHPCSGTMGRAGRSPSAR